MRKLLTVAASLTIALLPTISCSDTNNEQISTSESSFSPKASLMQGSSAARLTQDDSDQIVNSSLLLIKEIQNRSELVDLIRNPVTNPDGSIDYVTKDGLAKFLEIIDYKGDVNVKDVNYMISESVKAYNQGYDTYISNMNISSGAKAIMKDLIKPKVLYVNLEDYPEYAGLKTIEQEKLKDVYDVTNTARRSDLDDITLGGYMLGGAAVGAWIGSYFPWPGAPILGGVIGAVVGAVLWVAIKG
ncbi:MAG: hypothetical protein MUW56_06515 [Chryseobacterium sp.]|uniref:GlsB/YeaQ/YmgE family stress response membrane protein n=1 Tax=Chryseobacterium sp. TaxID=1871047 RepID=UPI0025BF37F4|nr:hypothetical protein [Chryseobacterium sp.]MCJ7933286.1 hypothetical protein [Chryseobacterium sp.]